jgi:16S rRNA (cytidine1402-2'-O)-methyltransferase
VTPKEDEDSEVAEPRPAKGGGKPSPLPQHSAGADRALDPGLYLTATPIGNAADITLRALNVLRQCDAIVAEDTRVTSRLLSIHAISRPLLAYNDHNASAMRPRLLEKLNAGARLALVSDAGTPLVSDPGHKLVRAAREEGIAVYPVPGPSAALAALIASGLPSDRFLFVGFLPAKSGPRRTALGNLNAVQATLILFESPQRLGESLSDMAELLGPREAAVARELTKLHEDIRVAPLDHLAAAYKDKPPPKGEITVVVGPPLQHQLADETKLDTLLSAALLFMPVKAASHLVAEATGSPRRLVYLRALRLKDQSADEDELP